jgi:hypothetical protein
MQTADRNDPAWRWHLEGAALKGNLRLYHYFLIGDGDFGFNRMVFVFQRMMGGRRVLIRNLDGNELVQRVAG